MIISEYSIKQKLPIIFGSTLLVAITTIVIVYFQPRERDVGYKYEMGKPWTGELLTADYDFDVLVNEEEFNQLLEEEKKHLKPYFQKDEQIEQKAIADFDKAVASDSTGVLSKYQEIMRRRLHFFYDRGIISDEDKKKLTDEGKDSIRIIKGKINMAVSEALDNIHSPNTLFSQFFMDDELEQHMREINRFEPGNFIYPNLSYNYTFNEDEIEELKKSIPSKLTEVKKGEKIVDRGDIVNESIDRKIKALLEKEKELHPSGPSAISRIGIGQTLFVFTLVSLFTIYLMVFRPDYFKSPRKLLMLYMMIFLFCTIMSEMVIHKPRYIYLIPFTLVPMITRVFFDTRTAFMTHVTIILISAITAIVQYEFILIELVAGMAAIYTLGDMSKRQHLFTAALIATSCAMLIYYSIQLISPQTTAIVQTERHNTVYYLLIASGVLLLLAYPLMYVIELVFGFISKVTYYELSDFNQPLLRMLSEKAPGTFAHSATVSNLAAEIANQVGADVLLVRTGALYHDIGKMENPAFFTENQVGYNPHERLTEKESAKVIISHVTTGLQIAKGRLPSVIKDFISTHHGKGITSFFYIKYKNAHPDEEVDIKDFSYPGPNPQTKEQAILMMADAVEAATKSLDNYTDETISQFVNSLIDKQVSDGFFKECPITFRDIDVAKKVLIERLKSIYHTRIKYPVLEEKPKNQDEKEEN